MELKRAVYLLIVVIGFGLFMALMLTHGEKNNLGSNYYLVTAPVYAATLWVAIAGVMSA